MADRSTHGKPRPKGANTANKAATREDRRSFGYVVGAIAAVCTIVLSVLFLKDRYFPTDTKEVAVLTPEKPINQGDETDLEIAVVSQLRSSLSKESCSELNLMDVKAFGRLTPADQSTSGFEGYFLEGKAELTVGGESFVFRLTGTGKGPAAQEKAITMASENFMAMIGNESRLAAFCKTR